MTLLCFGILARDGGHFIVVFSEESDAKAFRELAEKELAKHLPGVLFQARIKPLEQTEDEKNLKKAPEEDSTQTVPQEIHVLNLPVLQICQVTGKEPASDLEKEEGKNIAVARSVTERENKGKEFNQGHACDIIGLMHDSLYPDKDMGWKRPNDLAALVSGDYLALIHADGNGIGLRYKEWKDKEKSVKPEHNEARGEIFYRSMRVDARKAVVSALSKTFTERGGNRPYQVLMLGGDDLLLVCRAKNALQFAHNYAHELKNYKLADGNPLHVALGVVIAQSSYPLHRLHELAENLASSAKRLYRALPVGERTSVIDWQIITQSWFADVEVARQQGEKRVYAVDDKTETLLFTDRPYRVLGNDGLEGLLTSAKALGGKDDNKVSRSALRGLRGACEQGRLTGELAFERLPDCVRKVLSIDDRKLWQQCEENKPLYMTRALDVIGIWEISRLGGIND